MPASLSPRTRAELLDFEAFLHTADPAQPASLARIEATLLRLLGRLAARRRPRPVVSDRERVDVHRTLRQYLRQGEFFTGLAYRERPREKTLVVLLDGSESFRPFALWGAAVGVAVRRLVAGAHLWAFDRALRPLEYPGDDLRGMLAALTPQPHDSRPLSLAQLPEMLDEMARRTPSPGRLEAWVVSDLLLPPGSPAPNSAAIPESARQALRRFHRVRLLDPTTVYADFEDKDGVVRVPGNALRNLHWGRVTGPTRWRVAESGHAFEVDERTFAQWADALGDGPALTGQRATPYLRALGVDPIARRPDRSVFAELFFGDAHA